MLARESQALMVNDRWQMQRAQDFSSFGPVCVELYIEGLQRILGRGQVRQTEEEGANCG